MKPIFLVDDCGIMLSVMSAALKRAGLAVENAVSGEEALRFLHAEPALRIIITDLNMPGMDGIELVREIRKIPTYRSLPIVMMTTESSQPMRDLARAAGATDWLVKPVAPDNLLQVLQQVAPA